MRSRTGNISVLQALSITALAAFGAVAVDVGTARLARTQARNAAESVAAASTRMLDGTPAGIERAREVGEAIARANEVLGTSVELDPSRGGVRGELGLGYYEHGAFVADTTDPKRVTSVRARLPNVRSPALLAQAVLGRDHLTLNAASGSRGGGLGRSECPLPIAVPSCRLTSHDLCSLDVVFGPDNGDNGGWALIGSSRPSGATVASAISACSMASSVDDITTLNNGQITSAAGTLASAVSASSDAWESRWGAEPAKSGKSGVTNYGHVLKGQVIVFDDPAACSGTKYNGSSLDIVGYLSVAVYDVDTKGAASDRTVRMHTFCDTLADRPGGGWFGTRVRPAVTE